MRNSTKGQNMPSGVHDSALIVNAFRAKKNDVSADKFAKIWVEKSSEIWANKYAEQVGITEVLVHALRHRFFLERLKEFLQKTPDGVFINIGAGFTNYPYLISAKVPCCEIDTEVNITFKKQKLAQFELQGELPHRTIEFIVVEDLNNLAEITKIESRLKTWLANRSSFVLFEGVFFYLKISAINYLYRILASLQHQGDIVASTSFRPEECNKLIFQRLVNYCRTDYQMQNFIPTTLPTSFYSQQLDYSLATHRNYYCLSQEFGLGEQLDNPEEVLEEDLYILEKL